MQKVLIFDQFERPT